jgi:imidazoleglycerol-phosphate dehydratase
LRDLLAESGAKGYGSAIVPADEALASVALEASGRPLLVSNVDLSDAHVAGLDRDLVSGFLSELSEAAGLTLHVRLLHGEDARHVLEAIFKALGGALAVAGAPRKE